MAHQFKATLAHPADAVVRNLLVNSSTPSVIAEPPISTSVTCELPAQTSRWALELMKCSPTDWDENALSENLFLPPCVVLSIRILRDRLPGAPVGSDGISRGVGFVRLETRQQA